MHAIHPAIAANVSMARLMLPTTALTTTPAPTESAKRATMKYNPRILSNSDAMSKASQLNGAESLISRQEYVARRSIEGGKDAGQ